MREMTGRHGDGGTGGHGDGETRRRGDTATRRVSRSSSPCFRVPVSPRPLLLSPRPRVPVSRCPRVPVSPCPRVPASPRLRVFWSPGLFIVLIAILSLAFPLPNFAQRKRSITKGSHTSSTSEGMSAETRELVEKAVDVICLERKQDPKGSVPIDDMQARPSLPIYSPEAVAGAERARRLLPIAKELVIGALGQLSREYGLNKTKSHQLNLHRAISRVRMVKRIKPDVDSRDNASVFLRRPQTITFGTIFLAGLPSDEGMISVLAHELVHIADGDQDTLRWLFRAVGRRASSLTNQKIYEQRAEELTADLIGAMTARSFVSNNPDYDPLPRRISRSVAHNCVEEDEGDEDHLSPRDTIRALLAVHPQLARELVYGQPAAPIQRRN
jgi:hypothetical protein